MAIQDHNLKLTEQQYRDLELPSYSMLASIDKQGLDVVGGVKQGFNLKFGSLVDMMCFEPHRVDDVFYQGASVKPPTTNVKKICDVILSNFNGKVNETVEAVTPLGRRKSVKITNKLANYTAEILDAASKLQVYKNYSEQKTIDTVVSAGKEYFKDKITSRGKILIKPEMWLHASHTAATLISHPYTAKYFATGIPGVEIIYQYKFDAVVNGRRCKGMLDCLIINHTAKVIIPVDLKTGESPCKDFPMLYTSHRYYIQGGLYREALKSIVDNDFELMGYDVRPFEFVYISKLNPGRPMIFTVSEDMHTASLNGFTDRFGYEYTGVYELLDQYYYSVQNNNADYTFDQSSNKGRVEMNFNTITGV
tara:strand:- start:5632 stop:6723 length:1092 start_codon:yes stop_codon:yes gene_type:complete